MVDIAFVLVRRPQPLDVAAVIAAGAGMGLELTHVAEIESPQMFDLPDGAQLVVMAVDAPHPDAAGMARGPTAAPAEDIAEAKGHLIVTAIGLQGSDGERDATLAALTAAVLRGTNAAAAMLGHGAVFHNPGLFAELAAVGRERGKLPAELAVDVTVGAESDDRMSFLTHGMTRYGREEFYVTCPIKGKGALDFVFAMVRWMLDDPTKQLPTGDTLGRTAEEKLVIARVENPSGRDGVVIKLDLPS